MKARRVKRSIVTSGPVLGASSAMLGGLALGIAARAMRGAHVRPSIVMQSAVHTLSRSAERSAIGALAGFAGGQLLLAFFANAPMLTFYGFVPVALGGMGNIRGSVIAGLILGLFQQAANFLVGGIFASVAVFTAFIIVLLAFPDGLAGPSTQRRV